MQMMRDFGMGKVASKNHICHEADKAICVFATHRGRAFDPLTPINIAVANVVCAMLFGKQYDHDDENFRTCLAALNAYVHELTKPIAFFLLTPLGKLLLSSNLAFIRRKHAHVVKFIQEQVQQHKARYNGAVHDYVDAFLAEMNTSKDTDIFNGECSALLKNVDSSKHFY